MNRTKIHRRGLFQVGASLAALAVSRRAVGKSSVQDEEDEQTSCLDVRLFGAHGDGQSDDAPAFQEAINVVAGTGKSLFLSPGVYRLAKTIVLPNDMSVHVIGSAETTIRSDLPSTPNAHNATFLALGHTSAESTIVAGKASPGSKHLSVASLEISGSVIAKGSTVFISSLDNSFHGAAYTVVAPPSGSGPFQLKLDRPTREAFAPGDRVNIVHTRPRNIHIDGRGMTISGTASRYIEIGLGYRCTVENLRANGSLGMAGPDDYMLSFDVGGEGNLFRGLTIDGAGVNAGSCIELESNERSGVVNCHVSNNRRAGIELLDCVDCYVRDSSVNACTFGLSVAGDGNELGCIDCNILEFQAAGCTQNGIRVIAGVGTVVEAPTCVGCAIGVYLDTFARGTIIRGGRLRTNSLWGLDIGKGAKGTMLRDLDLTGNTIVGVNAHDDMILSGFVSESGNRLGVVFVSAAATQKISAGKIVLPAGGIGIAWGQNDSENDLYVDNVEIVFDVADAASLGVRTASGVAHLSNVRVRGDGAAQVIR
ncbi:MAG: glycosyl hydrolase family 28-related protein [Polyangiaceae bacterium]